MTFFGLIGTAFVGLIVGIIAGWLSPGRAPSGCIVTILVGVAGAFIARFIGNQAFGWYADGSAPGWIMSIVGAMLLLWVFRLVQGRR
ncbi:MAG: GlsB/YeaQ/YmgE family stress response membrane protein [Polymorphobacter sp.]